MYQYVIYNKTVYLSNLVVGGIQLLLPYGNNYYKLCSLWLRHDYLGVIFS